MVAKKYLSLKSLIDDVKDDNTLSLELLFFYFQPNLIQNSKINNHFDPDLYSTLIIVFIKSCTLYKQ